MKFLKMIKAWILICVVTTMSASSIAMAQDSNPTESKPDTTQNPLDGQWTDGARLALAQCLVGEADWGRVTEYSAISHLLTRRWVKRLQSEPTLTFERLVRRYCAVHRVSRPSLRQQWVRKLPWGELESDPGFPSNVAWTNYVTPWREVREFVENFYEGVYSDPTPSADHWGGAMDGVPIGGRLLNRVVPSTDPETPGRSVQLTNRFYAVDMAARRRFILSQREYRRLTEAAATVPASQARGGFRNPDRI
jgi:hypothetical protein